MSILCCLILVNMKSCNLYGGQICFFCFVFVFAKEYAIMNCGVLNHVGLILCIVLMKLPLIM